MFFEQKLRSSIAKIRSENSQDDLSVNITKVGSLFRIQVQIESSAQEIGPQIFETLAQDNFRNLVQAIIVDSGDDGANGTINWDISNLVTSRRTFENLEQFEVGFGEPGFHNRVILTCDDYYEENGGLGKLLNLAPNLKVLKSPSAPDSTFFDRGFHGLRSLTIRAGYETNSFIKSLSASKCFSNLTFLEYIDYCEDYIDGWKSQLTKEEDFLALLSSTDLHSLAEVTLESATFDAEVIERLKAKNERAKTLVLRKYDGIRT